MHAPDRLEAEDRADFEQVLRLALNTPEIREVLRRRGEQVDAGRLRSQALAATEDISAAAAAEYAVYSRLRAAAASSATRPPGRPQETDASTGGRGLLAALTVVAPILSVAAAVIFLLLGYALRLADTQRHLADALVGAGWITAALAALAALVAGAALIVTAVRHRSVPGGRPRHDAQSAIDARAAWRQALLERGMLPFLHRQLRLPRAPDTAVEPPRPGPPAEVPLPRRRSRLGYTSPDFASPDFASPDFAGPSAPSQD